MCVSNLDTGRRTVRKRLTAAAVEIRTMRLAEATLHMAAAVVAVPRRTVRATNAVMSVTSQMRARTAAAAAAVDTKIKTRSMAAATAAVATAATAATVAGNGHMDMKSDTLYIVNICKTNNMHTYNKRWIIVTLLLYTARCLHELECAFIEHIRHCGIQHALHPYQSIVCPVELDFSKTRGLHELPCESSED